jgi:hypothetical protein
MSSRRGAGEENILAMLERDSARRTGARMSGIRLASYGAAAALAGILAGGVAWLAYDNHKGAQELQARHDAVTVVAPPVMPDAVLPPQPPAAAAPAQVVDAPRTAVIVDESASKRDVTVAGNVPPLVMLPPHELKETKPVPTAARVTEERAVSKPVKPEPAQVAARTGVEKKADKAAKSASRAAKPAQAHASGPAKAKPAARAHKPAAPADTQVDSDVALISAIIQHSERHRGERGASAACSGAKCPSKAPRP